MWQNTDIFTERLLEKDLFQFKQYVNGLCPSLSSVIVSVLEIIILIFVK